MADHFDWRCWVQDEPWAQRRTLWLQRHDRFNSGDILHVTGVTTVALMESQRPPEGGVQLANSSSPSAFGDTTSFIQAIVDAAWEVGIKPKKLEEPTGELRATIRHLKDLRLLLKMPARHERAVALATDVPKPLDPDDEIPF